MAKDKLFTTSERIDAASALTNWFISQRLSEANAGSIMSLLLASIIVTASNGDRNEQLEGVNVLRREIIRIMAAMNEAAEDEENAR